MLVPVVTVALLRWANSRRRHDKSGSNSQQQEDNSPSTSPQSAGQHHPAPAEPPPTPPPRERAAKHAPSPPARPAAPPPPPPPSPPPRPPPPPAAPQIAVAPTRSTSMRKAHFDAIPYKHAKEIMRPLDTSELTAEQKALIEKEYMLKVSARPVKMRGVSREAKAGMQASLASAALATAALPMSVQEAIDSYSTSIWHEQLALQNLKLIVRKAAEAPELQAIDNTAKSLDKLIIKMVLDSMQQAPAMHAAVDMALALLDAQDILQVLRSKSTVLHAACSAVSGSAVLNTVLSYGTKIANYRNGNADANIYNPMSMFQQMLVSTAGCRRPLDLAVDLFHMDHPAAAAAQGGSSDLRAELIILHPKGEAAGMLKDKVDTTTLDGVRAAVAQMAVPAGLPTRIQTGLSAHLAAVRAEVAAAEHQLLDVNAAIRKTSGFLGTDNLHLVWRTLWEVAQEWTKLCHDKAQAAAERALAAARAQARADRQAAQRKQDKEAATKAVATTWKTHAAARSRASIQPTCKALAVEQEPIMPASAAVPIKQHAQHRLSTDSAMDSSFASASMSSSLALHSMCSSTDSTVQPLDSARSTGSDASRCSIDSDADASSMASDEDCLYSASSFSQQSSSSSSSSLVARPASGTSRRSFQYNSSVLTAAAELRRRSLQYNSCCDSAYNYYSRQLLPKQLPTQVRYHMRASHHASPLVTHSEQQQQADQQ